MKVFRLKAMFMIPVAVFAVLTAALNVSAGITGKVVGRVVDGGTGEGLIGANILIENTTVGSASDDQGYYLILNIPPGKYTLRSSMMGYEGIRMTQIEVVADRTTTVDFMGQ